MVFKLLRHVWLDERTLDTERQLFLERCQPLRQVQPDEVHVYVAVELHLYLGHSGALLFLGSRADLVYAANLLDRRL